jgi:hypothetical protein
MILALTMPANINSNLSDESKPFQERLDDVRTVVEENLRYTKSLYDANVVKSKSAGGSLEDMVAENLELTKKIFKLSTKIHRHIIWQQIFDVIKIAIIVGSLVWSAYLLYPMINSLLQSYQSIAGSSGSLNEQDLLKQLQAQIKK